MYKLCTVATPEYLGPLPSRKLRSHCRLRAGFAESFFITLLDSFTTVLSSNWYCC
jgi:hypothetical protein